MGCTAGQLACQPQTFSSTNQEGHTQEGAAKVPEVLSSLERLSQATGGMEKSWYRCIFPFGIISLVIGIAGTGVTYTYNDLPQTKVVSVVLLIVGLILVCYTVNAINVPPCLQGNGSESRFHLWVFCLYLKRCCSVSFSVSLLKTCSLSELAAEKGNFEAAVKLGIAYLYNEGPSIGDEGRADLCGRMAAKYFTLAECARSPLADPFIWLFIRPPWSPLGSCCKAVVYKYLKAECESNQERRGALLHCLAKVLELSDDEETRLEAVSMLDKSSCCGSVQSSYLLWEKNRFLAMVDPGRNLQCMRTLRDYAAKGCWEAQFSLAKTCASSNPLGLEPQACADLVAQLFVSCSSVPQRSDSPRREGINDTMRYILVDWLVEVATMKDFSSLALHVTVSCVDRYLARRSVPKARLQLLGISCMVICTRYISKEILTIREAVWLTDNTYQYEDLVRMMGEVISVLEGKIRSPTLLDYGEVLQSLLPMKRYTAYLFSYICELSLLFSPLMVPGPARLASAILLLTRALHNYTPVWPRQLVESTGFSEQHLVPCALLIYNQCFSQDVPKDYRHVSLTGVKQRFESDFYQHISKDTVMDFKELCQVLEVPEMEPQIDRPSANSQSTDIHTFLSSPSSNSKRREDSMHTNRGSFVATPTVELSNQEETLVGDILDWSLDASCSGYEGDQDSDGERECEVSVFSVQLPLCMQSADVRLSSDEDSMGEPPTFISSVSSKRPLSINLQSSGYSSVQSGSPSTASSSSLVPCNLSPVSLEPASSPASSGFCLLVPMQRPSGSTHGQVKRKNTAAHSGEEMDMEREDGEISADEQTFPSF
ncbi:Cyclin-F [Bagarius yarrelli]|uniref:Cyclin-F n=1 Tax=Bagarius yarrelli TaxID=175774 RepID=A0A556TW38_BAGYA|nr:Cyclin-F [Bagarius yarrelli]